MRRDFDEATGVSSETDDEVQSSEKEMDDDVAEREDSNADESDPEDGRSRFGADLGQRLQ
jgi:hypothetical protein